MALINCPECKREISSAAANCPLCGFPIADHFSKIEETEVNAETDKMLLEKIRPCDFICPEPRAKVCVKCGRPQYKYSDCKCNMSLIEVDYPAAQPLTTSAQWYLIEHQIIPRNIGDIESSEYRNFIQDIYNSVKRMNDGFEKMGLDQITKSPPDTRYYGKSHTEEITKTASYIPLGHNTDSQQSIVLHCPKCSSTAITTGARGLNWTFGLIGASKTVNRCGNCGYTWRPGK